jgi:hypothetical protein
MGLSDFSAENLLLRYKATQIPIWRIVIAIEALHRIVFRAK